MNNSNEALKQKLLDLYTQFAAVPSLSGSEQEVGKLVTDRLTDLHIEFDKDQYGNIKAFLPGEGKPILLNAHMDRVKPGLGYTPIIKGDLVYSDGTTNSGADDILGIASILVILESLQSVQHHRPIHAIFTVEEEIGGGHGAKSVDLSDLQTDEGIVIDNAFDEAGVIVNKGSNLVWAIMTITGKSVHSGKDLSMGVNALLPVLQGELQPGSYNNDETRVNVGSITLTPGVGNALPGEVKMLTEFRSFLPEDKLKQFIDSFFEKLCAEAKNIGTEVQVQLDVHCQSYIVDTKEPLVQAYETILAKRNSVLAGKPTFVGSDCNSFRARGLKTFVVSTGARNEHTTAEFFDINGISQVTQDLIDLLQS